MTHRVSRKGMSHLAVETECAEVPAESLIDSIQKIDDIAHEACRNRCPRGSLRMKVLTWNVWFDTHSEFDLRLQSLVTQLLAASPCVAGLQEVTPSFVIIKKKHFFKIFLLHVLEYYYASLLIQYTLLYNIHHIFSLYCVGNAALRRRS